MSNSRRERTMSGLYCCVSNLPFPLSHLLILWNSRQVFASSSKAFIETPYAGQFCFFVQPLLDLCVFADLVAKLSLAQTNFIDRLVEPVFKQQDDWFLYFNQIFNLHSLEGVKKTFEVCCVTSLQTF